MTAERRRMIEWQDPVEAASLGLGLSGGEYLRRILARSIPQAPIAATLGFELTEIGDGFTVFTMKPGEHHYNRLAMVHSGVVCTILDSAMGCAAHTVVPKGQVCGTAELKVNFVRPITRETPLLRAEGQVIHTGRQLVTAEGKLTDSTGRLYALGVATCLISDATPAERRKTTAGTSRHALRDFR